MKAKITRADKTVIELEGTAEELSRFIEEPKLQIEGAPSTPTDISRLLDEMTKAERPPHCPGIVPLPLDPHLPHFDIWWGQGCQHEFPTGPWMSVLPPPCTKCGFTPPNTIRCTNSPAPIF